MAFGIYIHIPYCLQICTYCDFAKYEVGQIPPKEHYADLILSEIRSKQQVIPKNNVTSIYFGGGTPSLFSPELLKKILMEIQCHFILAQDVEITLEINPGTMTSEDLSSHLQMGINRYSVGVQTFNQNLLTQTRRKHSVEDTLQTLSLLKKNNVNYSMDILYALPHQTLLDLEKDLDMALEFSPSHISCYYLTVPDRHKLSYNRPPDDVQSEMMGLLERKLSEKNIFRYEISNFSIPGKESKHNLLYWTDQPYWGLGLSAHSYFKDYPNAPWGARFWNPSSYRGYQDYIGSLEAPRSAHENLPVEKVELLEKNQALTDFCHTHLRKISGFSIAEAKNKFGGLPKKFLSLLKELEAKGLVTLSPSQISPELDLYRLSDEGKKLPNLVFEALTFLKSDLE